MKKKSLFILLALLFVNNINTHAVYYEIRKFRLFYYVIYQILHKAEGVPISELGNVEVLNETNSKVTFQYDGKEYTARTYGSGSFIVNMPEGRADRYLTRKKAPVLVLSEYDKY